MKEKAPHILIIGLHWPEPNSSAAGSRMLQLIRLFKEKDWKITFASPAKSTGYEEKLDDKEIEQLSMLPNDAATDILLKELDPDVVLFDRFMMEEQFGWKVAEVCPNALRILDTEDLRFLRKARHLALKQNRTVEKADLLGELAKREIASILRSDISLLISQVEWELLRDVFKLPTESLWYLPFLYDPLDSDRYNTYPKFEERKDFMFVGNFLHAPNYDSVLYLKNEVWPLIRKELPQANLHVFGAYTSQKVSQLENKSQGFYCKGRAESLEKTMQEHLVLLAPLRFGAGLKGKFFDAIHNGLPSITTSIGLEGITEKTDFSGFVSDNPQELADLAVLLYREKSIWEEKQLKGIGIINNHFTFEKFQTDFYLKLETALKEIDQIRLNNFTGQMLMHHRQQSTKYMSRWIELKNQLLNS